MQPITLYNFNAHNSKFADKTSSFTGTPNLTTIDNILSLKSHQLIKKAGILIDETWPKVRKKAAMAVPEFIANKNDKIITLKPVFNLEHEAMSLEVKDNKYIEKVIIDRINPNIFRYEKAVKTDHGSATLKTYSSKNGHNTEITMKVNDLVENYFPKFVPENASKKQHKL